MDLILAYKKESGSSSESEDSNTEIGSRAPESKDENVTLKPSKFEDNSHQRTQTVSARASFEESHGQNDSLASQISSTGFFNLSSKLQRSNPKAGSAKTSNLGNGIVDNIEIPDGEFWSEFVPPKDFLSSQSTPVTSHDEYYRKQIMNYNNSNNLQLTKASHEVRGSPKSAKSQYGLHGVRNASHPYLSPHGRASTSMDAKVCGWNVWSSMDPCVFTFTCHTKAVRHVEWCHGGKSVFSCSFDRTAQITDVETGKTKARLDHVGFVTCGSLLSSNPNLVATGTDNMVLLWDTRTPQAPMKHYTYKEAFGQVQDLTLISDDRELVGCGDQVTRDSADRSIMVWDVRSTAVLSNQVFQERYTCTRLKPHKDESHFLAQTHGGYIALFSTVSPYRMEKSKRFGGHKLLGYHIGFDVSPDGKLVYSGSAEGGVHVYDYRTGKLIRKLLSSSDDVIMDVACHPVLPSVAATCTWGGSIRLWQ
ncbi:WD repeat-containing protein 25 [Elysia marginata]|uniref:WD repeat-containing protein 25 n=1 Tax=Elysia marginata TaxID=1093978 RepID=A0AAV4FP03_9GAST|nr:WD repeat-containing protein 25 [Elysia marginata]